MAHAPQQGDRFLTIKTPLGPDALILTGFTGEESLSRLFRFRLELISARETIDATAIMRQSVTWSVVCEGRRRRYFDGMVRSFSAAGLLQNRLRRYTAEVVPNLWLLTQNADCRIFQEQTAVEIIEAVFRDRGFSAYDTGKLTRSYRKRIYCVQYRETDFDFVSRLMEEEGIFYYFEHADGRHTMVLADGARAYEAIEDSTVHLSHGRSSFERLSTWARNHAVPTGGVATRDYNPLEPGANMESQQPTTAQGADRALTLFDYPGLYDNKSDGDGLASVRIEEEEAAAERAVGRGEVRTFRPAGTFSVEGVPGEQGKTYALTWVAHSAQDNSQMPGQMRPASYDNEFACLPASVVFRPPRVTPKAVARGLQTAVVVGPSGSEIHTDEHGRIKVQFFWDRYGRNDEHASCWIRVAQIWAGPQWGAQFIPRIGHEVVVAFLEGDPDRPLVIGSVYNGRNAPPFDLPANKTQSGVRSRSSLNGSLTTCNEFRFEDKKGSELVFLHAEKDLLHEVENDEDIEIGNNQTIYVANKRTEVVDKGDESITLKMGSHSTKIELGDESHEVSIGSRETMIGNNETLTVRQNIDTRSNMGNIATKADMGNITTTASLGNIDTTASLGKITLTAMQGIELKVGASSVTIDQMGVTIKGMMVKLDGTLMTEVKGMMTDVKGTAMLTVKGGILMIN